MPKYLFSNDQRISELTSRVQWVAKYISEGNNLKDIPGKSDNNNAATLEYYYNLYPNTENTKVAITSPKDVIRNFVLKFQFPNTRTIESFHNNIEEKVFLAPFRMVAKILVELSKALNLKTSYMKLNEVLYYVFSDEHVCKNPTVNCTRLANKILSDRSLAIDHSSDIFALLEWKQCERQIREMMMVFNNCCESIKVSKGTVIYNYSESDEDFINKLINYHYFWFPKNSEDFELSNKEYISYMNMADTPYTVVDFNKEQNNNNEIKNVEGSLQQIFYGAPGTGKSHTIKEQTKGEDVVRTTFHPDSDYSTFVGAYKPTTKTVPVKTVIGTKAVAVEDENGKPMTEEKIVYEFVSQAFLQAYVEAWKKLAKPNIDDTVEKEYLIIEEINRGNCAQIFGDLFQLLDRGDHGFSEYPIKSDADMQKQLKKAFAGITIPQAKEINGLFKDENDIVSQVLNGEILLLPNNLYIWATMNTSDQSLFPIDSAFKRRWDWQYVPICDARKDWTIEVGENKYDWWVFLSKINTYIYDATFSEDKKLGYFFCKAENGVISAEKFVSKVIFYLWNDVFKDTEFDGDAFRDENGGKLSFDKFYLDMNGLTKVNEDKVGQFLRNLDIMPISNESVTE